MAENIAAQAAPNPKPYHPSSRTQDLRAIAQSHLTTIEAEDIAEVQRQVTAQRDLQKYAKIRRKDRLKTQSNSPPATTISDADATAIRSSSSQHQSHSLSSELRSVEKRPRFRPAQDILSRLQYDLTFKPHQSEYHIGYLERFEGIKEMPVQNWISESTDEEWIPMHRVKYVVRIREGEREVVWDRERRIDLIFGSGQTASEEDGHIEEKGDEGKNLSEGRDGEEVQSEAGGVMI